MSPPKADEAEKRHEVGQWLAKAWHDLETARIVSSAADGPLDTAIYHCQQAAEKSLKGFLVRRDVRFEKVHDLSVLLQQCIAVEPGFSKWAIEAATLTPYATAYRYPGEDVEPTREEFQAAYVAAAAIHRYSAGLIQITHKKSIK